MRKSKDNTHEKNKALDESTFVSNARKKTHVVRSSSCTIRFSARVSAAALFVFATRKLARAIIIGLLGCATFFQLCCISRITIACECVYRALRECRANPPPPPPPRGRRRITQQQLFSATREPRLRLLVDLLFRDE